MNRGERLYEAGLEGSDDERAIADLEKAIELFASVPNRAGAVAHARLALAERLVDRDSERALELVKQVLPHLTGPMMRRPLERARALEERLAS